MLRLKDKGAGVPGGFRYRQPETDYLVLAPHWWGLVDKVRAHRLANKLPIPLQFEEQVEEQLAIEIRGLAPYAVYDDAEPNAGFVALAFHERRWTARDVIQFTLSLGELWLRGNERVAQVEADRRAGVCAGCPSNVPVANCTGCNMALLKSTVEKLAGGGATLYDGQLQACQFCGCLNKAQVWFPLDILQRHLDDKTNGLLPEWCWKKKTGVAA